MSTQTGLIRKFLSLFGRRTRPRRFEAASEPENLSAQRPPLYGWQDIPTEVIVPERQAVVLVQIERRKSVGNPKG